VKEAVLAALREAKGGFISGEELSRRLGVSRTAIFKQIELLREEGYLIAASPRRGYALKEAPDLVTPAELAAAALPALCAGRVEYRPSVGSTNELAKELARRGAPEGTLVIADQQTAGKGRLGRSWTSAPGAGIWMSLLLRPAVAPHAAPRLTLLSAVAVAEGVSEAVGLQAQIKWPNDLQLEGRKFCGILTEMEAELERVAFVVCGIGINVNHVPEEFRPGATCLREAAGKPVRRAAVAAAVLRAFEGWHGQPFDAVLQRCRERSATLGRQVTAVPAAGGALLTGRAHDLDADGALLIESGGRLHRVVAGEVSIR
jgi:BirA family transcriptional regulator, biotin operon repressor / biotin---[acetyl-CoA-carboxylase] ligase